MTLNFADKLEAARHKIEDRLTKGDIGASRIELPGQIHEIMPFDSEANLINLENPVPTRVMPSELLGVSPGSGGHVCYQPLRGDWYFRPDLQNLSESAGVVGAGILECLKQNGITGLCLDRPVLTLNQICGLAGLKTLFYGVHDLQRSSRLERLGEPSFGPDSFADLENAAFAVHSRQSSELDLIRELAARPSLRRLEMTTSVELESFDCFAESAVFRLQNCSFQFGAFAPERLRHLALEGFKSFDIELIQDCHKLEYFQFSGELKNSAKLSLFQNLKHLYIPNYRTPTTATVDLTGLPISLESLRITVDPGFDLNQLTRYKNLKRLHLLFRGSSAGKDSIDNAAEFGFVSELPQLEVLVLDGPTSDSQIETIQQAIAKKSALKKLKLVKSQWTGAGLADLLSNVEELRLILCKSINWQTELGAERLPDKVHDVCFVSGVLTHAKRANDYQLIYAGEKLEKASDLIAEFAIRGNPEHFSSVRRKLTSEIQQTGAVPTGETLAHALAHVFKGNYSEALEIADKLIQTHPNNLYFRLVRLTSLRKIENYSELAAELKSCHDLLSYLPQPDYTFITQVLVNAIGRRQNQAIQSVSARSGPNSSVSGLEKICGTGLRRAKEQRDDEIQSHIDFVKACRGELKREVPGREWLR